MNYKYNSQISKRAEIPECHLFNILDFIVLQHSKKLSVKEWQSFLNITSCTMKLMNLLILVGFVSVKGRIKIKQTKTNNYLHLQFPQVNP